MMKREAALLLVALTSSGTKSYAQASDDENAAPSLPADEDEDDLAEMKRMLEEQQAKLEELEQRLEEKDEPELFQIRFRGYGDFGFFVPIGNGGVGWVRDVGNEQFPQYAGQYGWVFLGDILATAVNTRGEAADLGDAPAADRFDSVDSKGAPGFIVNEVNVRMEIEVAQRAVLRTSLNIVPRTGNDFALGDFLDLDIAEVEWVVTDDGNTSLFIGKILPVFGIEYKERKSDERFGITPSLIARYTTGTQLGLKARTKLFDDWFVLAVSVTNGSATTEQFHFYNEIDSNSGKTVNGRIAINVPFGRYIEAMAGQELEIGGSGTWGPQDRAANNEKAMWFVGADLTYRSAEFALKAQWIRGRAPGFPAERVWGIELRNSGYVEIDYMFLPFLGAMARAELRDAFVNLTTERAYITKQLRFTGGLRSVINSHLAIKAEYLYNREFSDIKEFRDDVFTSSFVVSY